MLSLPGVEGSPISRGYSGHAQLAEMTRLGEEHLSIIVTVVMKISLKRTTDAPDFALG